MQEEILKFESLFKTEVSYTNENYNVCSKPKYRGEFVLEMTLKNIHEESEDGTLHIWDIKNSKQIEYEN